MDVRCERCRAQYVFEDEQVTEAGLTVQCTNCGHLFKVKRKSLVVTLPVKPGEAAAPLVAPAPPPPAAPATTPAPEKRDWRVRQASGNVFTFKDLTTLQKWIVERKVSRDDEISLSGDQWKRLGNIAELATFFQVVEAAEKAQSAPAMTPIPVPAFTPPGGYPPPAGLATNAPAPPGGGVPGGGPLAQVNVSLPPGPAWEGQGAPTRSRGRDPAWSAGSRGGEDLGEAELRAVKGGSGKWVLLVLLLVALGGGAAAYYIDPGLLGLRRAPPPAPPAPPPAAEAKAEAKPEPPPPAAEPAPESPPPALPEKAPVMVAEPAPEAPPRPPPAPRTAASLVAEARRLRERGKVERALELFGRAVELEPGDPDALAGRGWCYLEMSQYAPAEASFQAALRSEPSHADALMGLAETYRFSGRKAEAVKQYERYLALHPDGEDAVAASNAVRQLKE